MISNTKVAAMNDSLEFLSKEWAFARLKPNKPTKTTEPPTENTHRKTTNNSEPSTECNTTTQLQSFGESSSGSDQQTTPTMAVPELILPNEAIPYDPKEFYKTGCIMAMLLSEQKPPAPTKPDRVLIVTTKTPWKLGDDESERARKAAHREWERSGAAACSGLAASRWYRPDGDKKVAPKPARQRRVTYKSRNDAAACSGLAASRWYGGSSHNHV